jgi:hypothetical protein
MSHRGSKSERKASYRPSLYDQINADLRKNSPSWNRWKNKSIWSVLFGLAVIVLWEMAHYR